MLEEAVAAGDQAKAEKAQKEIKDIKAQAKAIKLKEQEEKMKKEFDDVFNEGIWHLSRFKK